MATWLAVLVSLAAGVAVGIWLGIRLSAAVIADDDMEDWTP